MGMELLKETWSWKPFPSEKHFQSTPWAKCNNSSDIIITKGEKVILPAHCCDFSILKPHPLGDLEVMWFNMQACSQGMLLGHISTSTYHQVFLEVPGMLLATKKPQQLNLKMCLSTWVPPSITFDLCGIYCHKWPAVYDKLFPTVSHEPIARYEGKFCVKNSYFAI